LSARQASKGGADPARTALDGPLSAVCFLYGDDSFLVERALGALRGRLDEEGKGAPRTVWGDDPTERVVEALGSYASPTLFGGASPLVLRRPEALRGDVEEQVIALATSPPPGHLMVVGGTIDRRRRLFSTLLKTKVIACQRPTDRPALGRWVRTLAGERGVTLEGGAGEELLDRCGGALGVVASELDKLAVVLGKGAASADAVRRLAAGNRTSRVEELTEAVAGGDYGRAVVVLRTLMRAGEAPLRVLAFVAANVRRALHVQELHEAGVGADDIATRLRMPAWLVGRQLRQGSARRLEASLHALDELDALLKRSRPAEAVFEETLWRAFRRQRVGSSPTRSPRV